VAELKGLLLELQGKQDATARAVLELDLGWVDGGEDAAPQLLVCSKCAHCHLVGCHLLPSLPPPD
jgi:hypothetical protein